MAYVLGVDEAGYGPKLGPLVISASLWQVPSDLDPAALHQHLPGLALGAGSRFDVATDAGPAMKIGDSKQLYRPGGSLAALECGVLAALSLVRWQSPPLGTDSVASYPASWHQLLTCCDSSCPDQVRQIPWYRDFDAPLPTAVDRSFVDRAAAQLNAALATPQIQLLRIQSRVIFPQVFNQRLADGDNKATALSGWTLELVRQMVIDCDDQPLLIQGDKHGGRNRYGALLQHHLTDEPVQAVLETKQQSVYRWGRPPRQVEACFTAKGDQFLPAGLASMVSKYLRELSMMAFNAFWRDRSPGLRPTAGYPVDADRFQREIASLQRELAVPDIQLWRNR